jgi:serine/threonine-protein kinase
MEIKFLQEHRYACSDNKKIETGNTIYKAQDLNFGRDVCIKTVHILGDTKVKKIQNLERAKLEVRAMTALEGQTNFVPRIYEMFFNKTTDDLYIVMQWIYGDTLEKKMAKTEPIMVVKWMEELCNILKALENKRLTHRDIKPANIIIGKDGHLYLIDFNISISIPRREEGTFGYQAPEMLQTSKVTDRSKVDIFSIGVILYECFTKIHPQLGREYSRKKWGDVQEWKSFIEPIELRNNLSIEINDIIVKCMKYNPRDRFLNASSLHNALKHIERRL